jgi:hypothetical protein
MITILALAFEALLFGAFVFTVLGSTYSVLYNLKQLKTSKKILWIYLLINSFLKIFLLIK